MYSPRGGLKYHPWWYLYIDKYMSSQRATAELCRQGQDGSWNKKNFKGLEELGEPQYHSWAAMIKVALEDTNVEASDRTILEEHFQAVKSVSDLVGFESLWLKWSGALTSTQSSMLSAPWPSRGSKSSADGRPVEWKWTWPTRSSWKTCEDRWRRLSWAEWVACWGSRGSML